MYSYQIFFPKSMFKLCNMNVTLKRIKYSVVFVEKIQISHADKKSCSKHEGENRLVSQTCATNTCTDSSLQFVL